MWTCLWIAIVEVLLQSCSLCPAEKNGDEITLEIVFIQQQRCNLKKKKKVVATHLDVHDFGDLPEVNKQPNKDADLHHKVGLVIQDVEKHHKGLEHAKYDGAHRQPL